MYYILLHVYDLPPENIHGCTLTSMYTYVGKKMCEITILVCGRNKNLPIIVCIVLKTGLYHVFLGDGKAKRNPQAIVSHMIGVV